MTRSFLREIPIDRFTDKDLQYYTEKGYELVWKEESIEIWAS